MDVPVTPEPEEQHTRPTTAPDKFTISARAFDSEERAQKLGSLVEAFIRELSRQFDLSRLDGVTVAHDYAQALLDLDRGYDTTFQLTPSDTHVVGIAMTPTVIRDGTLKSHVLLNAAYMAPLEDFEHEHFGFVRLVKAGVVHNLDADASKRRSKPLHFDKAERLKLT
jgi:hypothetical protein